MIYFSTIFFFSLFHLCDVPFLSLREEFPGVFSVQVLCVAPALVVGDAAQTLPVYWHPQPHAAKADSGRARAG